MTARNVNEVEFHEGLVAVGWNKPIYIFPSFVGLLRSKEWRDPMGRRNGNIAP